MKLKLTLELNASDREALKYLIGRKKDVDFEEYRTAIKSLVNEKIRDVRLESLKTGSRKKSA